MFFCSGFAVLYYREIKECAQKNGPTYRLITFIIIEKNEYRYIVFVSHQFQNSSAKYHCNSKISFLNMNTQQKCHKQIIQIFNEKPRRLQKTIVRLAGVNQKPISKVILEQYKESLNIERKCGNGRKK